MSQQLKHTPGSNNNKVVNFAANVSFSSCMKVNELEK